MSQRNRVRNRGVIAALALSAVLSLGSPVPSRASGLWQERIPMAGLVERVWSWMAELRPAGHSSRTTVQWEKEGSAINPNGQPNTAPAPPPQSSGGGE